nr:hypothetical protein [Spirochaetia bacterium]
MTDRELKDLVASLAIDTKELKADQRKTDEQIDRLGKLIGNILNNQGGVAEEFSFDTLSSEIIGSISNNQGDVAEEFFFNTLRSKLKIGDLLFEDISPNVYKERGGIKDEYDILLTNGNSLAIVETKYKAHISDLEKLKNKKIPNFTKLFPVYKDYKIYAGIASFNINKDIERKAREYGFFVLKR